MEATLTSHPDRRKHARWHTFGEHSVVLVTIRPGHAATVIDISPAGALIETRRRLLPDTFVEMHVQTRLQRFNARGRVLRSMVASVRPACLWYRGAIQFNSCLGWVDEEDGDVVHLAGPVGGTVREEVAPPSV
jgi:hypothetical protein